MRLDPRTVLCLYLVAIVATLATRIALPLCSLLVVGFLVVVALRALRRWAGMIRLLLPLLIMLMLFSVIGGTVSEAVAPALKLLTLATLSTALFAAISVDEIADVCILLRLPSAISFVLVGGLRYAPTMAARWADLIDARRARGTDIPRGFRGLPMYATLLVPAVVRALRTADAMAEAMESRGFGTTNTTPAAVYHLWIGDVLLMMFSVATLCAYLIIAL